MNRRQFLSTTVLTAGALALPLPRSSALDARPANKHWDFALCHCCGAKTFEYHKLDCPRAAVPAGEEQFYESFRDRLIKIVKRTGKGVERFVIEPEYEGFRFVRVWVEGESAPYTWNHTC